MNNGDQNLRLLFLAEIFNRQTDENHTYSAVELVGLLENYGVHCERKSIYRDVDDLREYGMDIVNTRAKANRGYYLRSRKFSVPEVRLLTDAVQAANFISEKNTKSLIYKIGGLVSEYQEEELREQIYIDGSRKTEKEDLYETIRILDKAIKGKKQVMLNYAKRTIEDNFLVRNEGKTFIVNPYAMLWSNDHYYLICNNNKYSNLMHLRLDRITELHELNIPVKPFSKVSPYTDRFDVADYTNRLFNMFSGEAENIVLSFSKNVLDEMLEKFGENVPIKQSEDGNYLLHAEVEMSEGLVNWILQFGCDVKVIKPKSLANAIKEKLSKILEMYE